jgi:hypothetical protein
VTRAGGSAGREYERRRRKEQLKRRRNFKRAMTLVVLTPFIVYGAVRLGAWAANRWLISWMFRQFDTTGPHEVLDGKTANLLGLALAATATLRMAQEAWGSRPTTEAWRKGQEGEIMTGASLDALPETFITLHDLTMPGTRANIDHLVIGPPGVFTVETKHYSSDVVIRSGVARHSGRSMDSAVDQANRQAEVVRDALASPARAIICVQGAGVTIEGRSSRAVVDGVLFCSGPRLAKLLTRLEPELHADEVKRLATLAEQHLGRSAAPVQETESHGPVRACDCGGQMVVRHRRADGAPFWGCSRYPKCRTTSSV